MDEITFENMSDKLAELVPSFKLKYIKELEEWGNERPGAHYIYGLLFCPYLEDLLKFRKSEAEIARLFKFIEDLANNKDVKVQEVVCVTILEYFMDNKPLILKAKEYMGDTTLKFLRELYDFWE